MIKLRLANVHWIDEHIKVANDWLATTHRFNNAKPTARLAIMEFLANKCGLTIYPDHKDIEK